MLINYLFLLLLTSCCCPKPYVELPSCVEKISQQKENRSCLVNGPLTPEEIVTIALFNNPELQARFERIGIAKGELINACLLTNPSLSIDVRFPDQHPAKVNSEAVLTFSILDVFLKPLQQHAASLDYRKAHLEAAQAVLELTADVKEACYHLHYLQRKLAFYQQILTLMEATKELAQQQYNAGNISIYTFQQRSTPFFAASHEALTIQTDFIKARETLNLLMGLHQREMCWSLADSLQMPLGNKLDLNDLIEEALEERLDLQAAALEVQRIAKMIDTKQWWSYTDARIGVSTEQEVEGIRVTGPIAELSVPLFNTGQGDRTRLMAELRQSQDLYEALKIAVISQVREAAQLVQNYRQQVELYQKEILPLQTHLLSSATGQYNFMTLGTYDLLDIKRRDSQLQSEYMQVLSEYWSAYARLQLAMGH